MSDKSNKYGYVGVDIPAQSFGANKGVFSIAEINELVANNKWTTGGQLELIETQTYSSNVSFVDFDNIKSTEYDVHFATYSEVTNNGTAGVDNKNLAIRFKLGSTVYSTAGNYEFGDLSRTTTDSIDQYNDSNATAIGTIAGNFAGYVACGYVYFYNLGKSNSKMTTYQSAFTNGGNNGFAWKYGGGFMDSSVTTTEPITGIRFLLSDLTDFEISLYGVKSF